VKVTCIVPTHDRPTFLAEALDSITAQTRQPDEVVVVDDHPSESTAAITRAANSRSGPGISYVAHPDGNGASSSRNRGAALGTGETLAFLDDDDLWEPTYLETATRRLDEDRHAAVVTWMTVTDGRGGFAERSIREGLQPADALAINPGVTGSNLVVRRGAFETIGGFDEALRVSNDRDFFIRLLDAGFGYEVVADRLVLKRAHPGARLATSGATRIAGYRAFVEKHETRMTGRDRRLMAAKIARVARQTASTPTQRWWETARLVWLAGPSGVRQLRSRRLRRAQL